MFPQSPNHASRQLRKRETWNEGISFRKKSSDKIRLKKRATPIRKNKKKKKKGISIRFESEEKGTLIWPWRESVTNGAYRLLAPITLHRGEGGGGVACSTGN